MNRIRPAMKLTLYQGKYWNAHPAETLGWKARRLKHAVTDLLRIAKEYDVTILTGGSRHAGICLKNRRTPSREVRIAVVEEQFRFPRSPSKRLWKKWSLNPRNYRELRYEPMCFRPPLVPHTAYRCADLLAEEKVLIPIVFAAEPYLRQPRLWSMRITNPIYRALREMKDRLPREKAFDFSVRQHEPGHYTADFSRVEERIMADGISGDPYRGE